MYWHQVRIGTRVGGKLMLNGPAETNAIVDCFQHRQKKQKTIQLFPIFSRFSYPNTLFL